MEDVAGEEIPQLGREVKELYHRAHVQFAFVPREKKPRVYGEALRHSPTQAAAVAKVLDDDNLLSEIIVRVGFPTTLVCAALVCKRWLAQASDPKFLSRFRKLHPPCLLGFYITEVSVLSQGCDAPRFVPMMPRPPELATVIGRLKSYYFGAHEILQYWNGSVFTRRRGGTKWIHGVHHPLCAHKGMQIVPPLPPTQGHNLKKFSAIVSKEEGSGLSYLYVLEECTRKAGESTVRVYMLRDGVWRMHTSATSLHGLHFCQKPVLVDNKIYFPLVSSGKITFLDMTASCFSTIQLPHGVRYQHLKTTLSGADDASSLYLIDIKEFQLSIWLHKGDTWLLIDTICLNEIPIFRMSDLTFQGEDIVDVRISQVGDNGQFVFLRMGRCIFYLDIKYRTLCKVYENTVKDRFFGDVHPCMMMWPPTFPVAIGDCARFAFRPLEDLYSTLAKVTVRVRNGLGLVV